MLHAQNDYLDFVLVMYHCDILLIISIKSRYGVGVVKMSLKFSKKKFRGVGRNLKGGFPPIIVHAQ